MNLKSALLLSALAVSAAAHADDLALFTFENLGTATAGPIAADSGVFAGSSSVSTLHSGASTYSTPVGNGSSKSYSSTNFVVGDYLQLSSSTTGYSGLTLSFDQASSNTGPGQFTLQYSANGGAYASFQDYTVQANATPNLTFNGTTRNSLYTLTFDLSGITALNNATTVGFRLLDRSTVSANGGTVASTGTDRVDNLLLSGTVQTVPEPSAFAALGLGAVALLRRRSAK